MKSNQKQPAKHVAHVLRAHINDVGDAAFPEIATIAKEASLGRSTVIRSLKELEQGGWITKRLRGFAKRKWSCLEYLPRFPDQEIDFDRSDVHQRDVTDVHQRDLSRRKTHRSKSSPNPSAHAEGDELKSWFYTEFWPKYPRQEAELQALRALRKIAPSPEERALILAAVAKLGADGAKRASRWLPGRPWAPRRSSWVCACGAEGISSTGGSRWQCRACATRDLFNVPKAAP